MNALENAKNNPGNTEFIPELKISILGYASKYREILITSMLHAPGVRGIILNSRDITERKLMAQEAEESRVRMSELRNRLNDAVESFTDGFMLFDADDRIVLCNSAFRAGNKSIEEYLVPGTHFKDLIQAMYSSTDIIGKSYRTEEKIKERIRIHENPELGPWVVPFESDRWFMITEYKTHDGGTALIRSDISGRIKAEQDADKARK